MSYGLRVWSDTGILVQDVQTRILHFYGVYSFAMPIGVHSIAISVPELVVDGKWFAHCTAVAPASNPEWMMNTETFFMASLRNGHVDVFRESQTPGWGTSIIGEVSVYRC